MNKRIVVVDYMDEQHAGDLVFLLNQYAADPMGGGVELEETVRARLPSELARIPHAFSILCYVDNRPAGLVNCFEGFSTFTCKPLVNIHDVVVSGIYRGQGICRLLLEKVEEIARQRGCCKLTLEVLDGNGPAKSAYRKSGFSGYELDPALGQAHFWQKRI